MMTNKYFKIVKKTTIDYIENRINVSEFKETFKKLDEIRIYKDLDKSGYKGISNFISAIQELDDQSTLESQWIVEIINLFYSYFTNNYGYVYSKYFYKFLKIGLNKNNKNPVELSFNKAIESYLNKKISGECLAYIANEFLNNLNFFKKEIYSNQKLSNILNITSKLNFNKVLEDLSPKEKRLKLKINEKLIKY